MTDSRLEHGKPYMSCHRHHVKSSFSLFDSERLRFQRPINFKQLFSQCSSFCYVLKQGLEYSLPAVRNRSVQDVPETHLCGDTPASMFDGV